MKKPFNLLAKPYYEQTVKQLAGWIQIPSIHDETTIAKGQPFGKAVYEALQYIGRIAEKDGFEVTYNDGYATEISFGKGPLIGVYAHADVVPVSGTWQFPSFSGTVADGKMYGRGTSDDKGPGMAAYMAMRLLKDNRLIDGYRVRLVIGGNEERGSGCLRYYFHELKKPHAVAGFTPDGEFPLIYGEKGISNYHIKGSINLGPIMKIMAGVVSNSVIDKAIAIIKRDETIEAALKKAGYKYAIKHTDAETEVTVCGRAAHGSVPEMGINAGLQLLEVLGRHYNLSILTKLAEQYRDPFGKTLGHYYESPLLHHTTYNVGLINYDGTTFSMVVNFRYPETVDVEGVIGKIKDITPLPVHFLMGSKPLLVDPKSEFIQTLLRAYQDETGDTTSPMITIGGGTYAKEAKNTIAFGSNFPGKIDNIHDANEKIDLDDLYRSIAIYARAINDLGRLYAAKK